ncbi:GNAT family N-acetyltransferase [Halalkalibacter urbisdiaboli]|uniref:GNAT family N-acetyltransferase n=1 Tax=Halalkalibacter urbisdiaboli TaxID=1960589 RepID=UPI000B4398D6|nr:GNAT family N-acetyltransferase [Halalkalibacter urbisdiaboli]
MDKSTLFKQLLNMEVNYVSLFSDVIENEDTIKFVDSALPDMFTHNFTFYKSNQGLLDFITKEIEKKETKEKGFYRVETSYPVSSKLLESLPVKPQVCTYDIMYIEAKKFAELKGNTTCRIVRADNNKVLEDGIIVDITANQKEMGLDFAQRRINRKAEIYNNDNKALQLFVCYLDKVPIGNIEYMQLNQIVKLEDFDIIEEHQRKGFGTSVLRYLIENAYNNNVEIVYLITNNADSAKEMYEKNGFTKIGEKTEFLFFL